MNDYFECKVTFLKTLDNGKEKKVTECYIVNAVSFTDAEAKITEHMSAYLSVPFEVKSIRKYKVAEIVPMGSGDTYFKCKLNFITLDEKSGLEKKTAVNMLVNATTLDDAKFDLVEFMKGTLADYSIEKIEETKIMALI